MVRLSSAALACGVAFVGSTAATTNGVIDTLFKPAVADVVPQNSLTHFCVITGWDVYNDTLREYASLLGQAVPTPGIAGGLPANGTYLGKPLTGQTKIAFLDLNNMTRIEVLAGDPDHPSWWRDVYDRRGFEIHHMGYQFDGEQIWDVVTRFEQAGLGHPVQWARWGNEKGPHEPGAGCYVYMDSQSTLGVTTELLTLGTNCDSLPAPSGANPYAWMPSIPLKNAAKTGERFPVIGLGTGGYGSPSAKEPECWWDVCDNGTLPYNAITKWLEIGGRRIDDATSYYHPKATGRAFKDTTVPREDIYYVSKTGPSDPLGYEDVLKEAESIKTISGIDYVDALLIHWPTDGQQGTIPASPSSDPLCQLNATTYDEKGCRLSSWRAMVHLFETGFARAIGVSNYNETHLQEIVDSGMPLPALTQLPYNPHRYRSHARMEQMCKALGILVTGYSPLGVSDLAAGGGGSRGGHVWPKSVGTASLMDEPAVLAIADQHNATAAQVLVAWSLAVGVPVNPRTCNETHMEENLLAWEVTLNASELLALSSLPESTCDIDPNWYECTPTATACPPQCCDTAPCKADAQGNCCAGGGQ